MPVLQHIKDREPCPFLPQAQRALGPSFSRSARADNNPGAYYLAALTCAQSLWLQGKPAQALLQLNHALSVPPHAEDPALLQWPLPYQAIVWIFTRRHEDGFMGNPVRHYQHLASRMSGPNKHVRTWRAWACFHLTQRILPADDFPTDLRQIEREKLVIPTWREVLDKLNHAGADQDTVILNTIAG